jgi:hypothetical protein
MYTYPVFSSIILFERPSFLQCVFLTPWSKNQMAVAVWVYFWVLHVVPLVFRLLLCH